MKYINIKDMKKEKTYQHWRNKQMIVYVVDKFETSKGLHFIFKHKWINELHVCLASSYEKSKWKEI